MFRNETEINDKNFNMMMFYQKIFCKKSITIVKLVICIFIISSSIVLDIQIIEKFFYIIMAILGIKETLQIKETKSKDVKVLKYDFFENCFQVNNCKQILEIPYSNIKHIIDTKDYYYFVIANSLLIIAKNGFTVGNKSEIKYFLKMKRKKEMK